MNYCAWAATCLGLILLSGCSQPAQGGAVANGPPGPSWTPETRGPVTAPPPAPADIDVNVATLVRRTLKHDPNLAPLSRHVHVSLNKGVLTLRGRVPTPEARQLIADKVSALPGVDGVQDQLSIGR